MVMCDYTWRSLFFLCSWTFLLSNCWADLNTQHFKHKLSHHKSQLCSSVPEYIFSMRYFLRKSMLLFSVIVLKRNASNIVKITQVYNFWNSEHSILFIRSGCNMATGTYTKLYWMYVNFLKFGAVKAKLYWGTFIARLPDFLKNLYKYYIMPSGTWHFKESRTFYRWVKPAVSNNITFL